MLYLERNIMEARRRRTEDRGTGDLSSASTFGGHVYRRGFQIPAKLEWGNDLPWTE
jgi:hypothetical protein